MPGSTAAASAAGATTLTSKARQLPGRDGDGGAERLDGGRVVDQDVDAARREHGHRRAAAVLLIGQIGGHDADLPGGHAPLAQKDPGLLQLPGGAGEQDHAGAGVGQPERGGAADTSPGTGDQCGLASEVSCHGGLP
jgi:hypothetical protein